MKGSVVLGFTLPEVCLLDLAQTRVCVGRRLGCCLLLGGLPHPRPPSTPRAGSASSVLVHSYQLADPRARTHRVCGAQCLPPNPRWVCPYSCCISAVYTSTRMFLTSSRVPVNLNRWTQQCLQLRPSPVRYQVSAN